MLTKSLRLLAFALALGSPLAAQSVHYTLRIDDPVQRVAVVTARFPTAGKDELLLFLPTWSPGFYRVESYARNVLELRAASADGVALAVEQPTEQRWRIGTRGAAEVVATYSLRCEQRSVTGNQIAPSFAVLCGPPTFIAEVGALARPHDVRVELPEGWREVATALRAHPDGAPRHYRAADYDVLVDAPLVLGAIETSAFEVDGARHEWAVFGSPGEFDHALLVKHLQPIATEICHSFGVVPFERYVFLAGFRGANGGLEHLDSTLVSLHPRQTADDAGLLSFLAHEYAHAFNVKRLRPVELGPFDYESPPRTANLWISEGLTTWIGDLAVVRSGAIGVDAWLAMVSHHIGALQSSPGRAKQTLAEASLGVWTTSTSGVGGDPEATISYYVKGPVVGFALEARLRTATEGAHGLDELLRRAYARYSGERGFTTEQFEALADEIAGADQSAFFERAIRSTAELDYSEALQWLGLRFASTSGDARARERWKLEIDPEATAAQAEHLRRLLLPTPKPSSKR
ncbi:MAG: M61 family metallopeptidase [Planctomycetes bacterium]|nr:M61 family metallopeptidase [Planctomycetota bacterium]